MPKQTRGRLAVPPDARREPITAEQAVQFVLERGELLRSRRQILLVVPLELWEFDLLLTARSADADLEEDDPAEDDNPGEASMRASPRRLRREGP
jgi:hypothetical protein